MKIDISSYIGIDNRKYKYSLLNPTGLNYIIYYTMEDYIGDSYFNNLPQQRLKLIYGSISSPFYIINSPEQHDMINQEKKLAYVIDNI